MPSLDAEDVLQSATVPVGQDWNNPVYWDGNPLSTEDTYYTVPIGAAENQFTVNGTTWANQGNMRDSAGGSTFEGGSLVLNPNTRLLGKANAGGTNTANIILDGGFITSAADTAGNTGSATLTGTIHQTAALSAIGLRPNRTNNSFTFDINSTITGSGTMQLAIYGGLGTNSGLLNLNGDISAFTGTFYLAIDGATATGSAFSINASAPLATVELAISSSANFHYNLTSDVTFGAFLVGETTLDAGTYGFAELDVLAPGKFIDSGGSITVVPEPGTTALVALALLGATATIPLRRRRQAV